jgi:hypothetical protein
MPQYSDVEARGFLGDFVGALFASLPRMSTQKVTMGAFRSFDHARDAVIRLESVGVRPSQISLVAPERARNQLIRIDKGTKAADGAGIGGATGVALGGLIAG